MEWWLIGSAIASVIGSLISTVANYRSNKSAQSAATYENMLNYSLNATTQAQNQQNYLDSVERNSVKNQMKEYAEAGVNPNLANANFVAMPAFQFGNQSSLSTNKNTSLRNDMIAQLGTAVKSSFYDMLIKKEQYLQLRDNRQLNKYRILSEMSRGDILRYQADMTSLESVLNTNFLHSLVDEKGDYNSAFYDLLELYKTNYNNKLLESGYRNANLISQQDVLSAKSLLTEEQIKKVVEETKRLRQLLDKGDFESSDLMRAIQVISSIFKIFK